MALKDKDNTSAGDLEDLIHKALAEAYFADVDYDLDLQTTLLIRKIKRIFKEK